MAEARPDLGKSGHIRGFDGLRAISILFVVLTHYGLYHQLPDVPFIRHRLWHLCSGVTGVNIFFALSGFLITRLLLQEQDRRGRIALKRFYIRRFLRLSPPFLLFFVLLIGCVALGLLRARPIGLVVSFCYLYNYIPHPWTDGSLSHTWSLAVEEQFYLVWPFLLTRLARKWLVRGAALLIGLAVLAGFLLPLVVLRHNGQAYPLDTLFHIEHWFFPAAGPIMVGALTSVLARTYPRWIERITTPAWSLLVAAALFAAPLYLPFALFPLVPVVQAAGVCMLLMRIVERQGSPLARALEVKPLAYIGKISYGIYIYHVLIIGTGPGGGIVHAFPLDLAVILALSIASYELYERPLLKLKERFA